MPNATPMVDLLPSWRRSLAAEGKSPRTLENYLEAATLLCRFLGEREYPTNVDRVNRGHIEEWLVALRSPATSNARALLAARQSSNPGGFFR